MLTPIEFAVILLVGVSVADSRTGLTGPTMWRRPPASAIALWAAVAVMSAAQFAIHGWEEALRRDPTQIGHGQLWRLVTSIFVQDGGSAGTILNLAILAIVAVPAARYFGGATMWALFLGVGIALNVIGAAYGSVGAGNSGATLGLTCALVGHTSGAALRDRGLVAVRTLPLCVIPPIVGALAWALFDYHGEAEVIGWLVGLTLGLILPQRFPPTKPPVIAR